MPSIGTQMYWHQAPIATPPWDSDEQRTENLTVARQLKHVAISPLTTKFMVGNRPQMLETERIRQSHARRRLRNVGQSTLHVEPLLSHRCAMNMLLASLGVPTMTHQECVTIVESVRSKLVQSDNPMVSCVQAVASSRGLDARSLTREELKHRRGTFFPSDLPPQQRALILCSKIEPLFVGLYTEWLPTSRAVGDSVRRGYNGAMRILCPAQQPQPWHKRLQVLKRVDRNEVVCVYLTAKGGAGGVEENGKNEKKANTATQRRADSNSQIASTEGPSSIHDSDLSDIEDGEDLWTDDNEDSEEDDESWDDFDGFSAPPPSAATAGSRTADEGVGCGRGGPMLLPLQLEPNASVADPFARLPLAHSVILSAVQESLKNIQSRSSATWTQRLLRRRDRQLLYNLTQSQMAMME